MNSLQSEFHQRTLPRGNGRCNATAAITPSSRRVTSIGVAAGEVEFVAQNILAADIGNGAGKIVTALRYSG